MKKPVRTNHSIITRLGVFLLISIYLPINLLCQEISITRKTDSINQYSDIHFSTLEANQIIDFSKLIKVYINKGSVVMIDMEKVSIDQVGEIVYDKLKKNIDDQNSVLDTASIVDAKTDLKILFRKSILTNKADYIKMMELINQAIWDIQKYYSKQVYQTDFKHLTIVQKKRIEKLVPLDNIMAEDVGF